MLIYFMCSVRGRMVKIEIKNLSLEIVLIGEGRGKNAAAKPQTARNETRVLKLIRHHITNIL